MSSDAGPTYETLFGNVKERTGRQWEALINYEDSFSLTTRWALGTQEASAYTNYVQESLSGQNVVYQVTNTYEGGIVHVSLLCTEVL